MLDFICVLLDTECKGKKKQEAHKFVACLLHRQKQTKKRARKTVYLCSFALFFSGVLKEPNLRFESAQMTSSKRLFDELIKAL